VGAAEPVHVIGELVEIGAVDARIDQDRAAAPRTTMALLRPTAIGSAVRGSPAETLRVGPRSPRERMGT
jgi:hypothetical protein